MLHLLNMDAVQIWVARGTYFLEKDFYCCRALDQRSGSEVWTLLRADKTDFLLYMKSVESYSDLKPLPGLCCIGRKLESIFKSGAGIQILCYLQAIFLWFSRFCHDFCTWLANTWSDWGKLYCWSSKPLTESRVNSGSVQQGALDQCTGKSTGAVYCTTIPLWATLCLYLPYDTTQYSLPCQVETVSGHLLAGGWHKKPS